ncbi:cell division protein FtsQ/DivIB [Pleionea sediminis]|uniref:cell division protein FtsQ/DivIB n=1 Tax=Pleionea sediminis TaxID=2569479 RepID=UPI001185DFD8|nr:cell division protein FtsQ/DivIB [Pleionea sediminis]
MSDRKRRMATVKTNDSKKEGAKWLKAVAFSFLGICLSVASWRFAEPISEWWSKTVSSESPVSMDKTQQLSQKEDVQTTDRQTENWRVALLNSAEFVSEQELEVYLKSNVESSFFTLSMDEITRVMIEHPWVKSVSARKIYPNTLMLSIEEHQPWLNLNNKQLISQEGIIFEPTNINKFAELPLLYGKFGDLEDLLSMYHFFSEQMPENDYRIVRLDFSAHQGWIMKLENGIRLYLGKKDLPERLERFLLVVEKASTQNHKHLAYIDLRYQSGVAVGWEDNKNEQVAHN